VTRLAIPWKMQRLSWPWQSCVSCRQAPSVKLQNWWMLLHSD